MPSGSHRTQTIFGLSTGNPAMNKLHDNDFLQWTEQQAALLRRIAAREPVNEAPDWPNIIEAIERAGSEQLHAVTSLLVQALVHMLKAESWPQATNSPEWLAAARRFRADAVDRFSPSMRHRIDLASLYADALAGLPHTMNGRPPRPAPNTCPVTLDELLSDDPAA
jgi:hypothetical protein